MILRIASRLLFVVNVLWTVVALAGGQLPGDYQDTGINPFRATINDTLDEHIDPFTGRLQLHHTDAVFKGNGGFDLALQRSYNSPSALWGTISDTLSYTSTPNLGVGWRMLIGGRMSSAVGTGSACAGGNVMVFEMPDGHHEGFFRQGDGSFLSMARWKGLCVANGVQIWSPGGTRYDLYQTIGEWMPGTAQNAPFLYPTHIQDRNGNYADFAYTTAGQYTTLTSVSTSDGRALSFTYMQLGTIKLLNYVTTPLGTWTFSYNPTPAWVDPAYGYAVAYFLTSVQPPTGSPWQYTYNGCSTSAYCGMNQVIYPEGGNNSYAYGTVDFHDGGPPAPVIVQKQIGGWQGAAGYDGNNWLYTYTPGSFGVNDTTTVASALGTVTYSHVGGSTVTSGSMWQVGLLMQRTHTDTGSATLQTETYTWDKQQVSPYPLYDQFGRNDGAVYAPLMTGHTINRNSAAYSTRYSTFDAYGNPQTIVETSPVTLGSQTRTTNRTYYVDTTKWIVNLPQNDTIPGVGNILRGYDSNANLTSENHFGVTTTNTYLSDGSLQSRTDANGHQTTYPLYQYGVALTENRPEGVTITRTVDPAGNVISQSDGAGNVYHYTYDGLRRLASKTPPVHNPTTVTWTGSAVRTATRAAYVETAQFSGAKQPYLVTRDNIPTLSAYDSLSHRIFESYPGQVTPQGNGYQAVGTFFLPDLLGRLTRVANPDSTARTLVNSGTLVTETDEQGSQKTYHYAAFGDPDKRFLMGTDLPKSGTNQTITRDLLGNMTSVTQGSVTRTYGYNGSYFLTSITDPETGTTTFGRDAVGNMTSRKVGTLTTNFIYDGLNRLTGISYPNSGTVAITYLGNGRTASVTNAQATRTYGYDANANLISETLLVGGQAFTVGYSYDGNDALSSITYPLTNEVVALNPDHFGRPTTAGSYIVSISYYNSGNPKEMKYANGTTMAWSENARLWPSALAAGPTGAQTVFLEKNYSYDGVGNVMQIEDQVNNWQSLQMTYDQNYQLFSTTGPWTGDAAARYDPVGNLTSYNSPGKGSLTYTYGADNKLASINSSNFTYDVYGNVTSDGSHTYQYDDASNLTCADCGGGAQIAYAYDGNNRRVSRTKSGVTTYYVHAANGDLLLEYTPSTHSGLQHIYVHGKRVATKRITF